MSDHIPTNTHTSAFDSLKAYLEELMAESDRAAVIVGAAKIDYLLCQLIKNFLLPAAESSDELTSLERPISSFSSRINFAYRVGLISRDFRQLLHLLRKIRNDFAHGAEGTNIDSGSTGDRVTALLKTSATNGTFSQLVEESGKYYGLSGRSNDIRVLLSLFAFRLYGACEESDTIESWNSRKRVYSPCTSLPDDWV